MFQSPPKYLIDLAKSGHAEALNTLLSYFMQSIGTTARSFIQNGFIELILEGNTSTPNQKQSEKYLRSFFDYLQIPAIQEVKVFAKSYDTHHLAWFSTLKNCSPERPFVDNDSESVERDPEHRAVPSANTLIANHLRTPQPIAFENLPPNLQANIRRAGLRSGDTRSIEEAKQIYEMMPENVRRGGIDAVTDYKQKHDWSHKIARSKGGSNHPSNGDWESKSINRQRGSDEMQPSAMNDLAKAKAQINFQEGTKIVGAQAAKAGVVAFGVEVAFSGLENFLAVRDGEKTVEQALGDTLLNSAGAAVIAIAVVGGVTALTLAFPPAGIAIGALTPYLQIVGVTASIGRLVTILSNSGKVQGIDRVEALMLSYGIDEVELDFRDLEVEDDLLNLKLAMQKAD